MVANLSKSIKKIVSSARNIKVLTTLVIIIVILLTAIPSNAIAQVVTISIENVKVLPNTVKTYTSHQFKAKLMTAIYLKKKSITIEISRYNKNDYNYTNINKYIDAINFEKCFDRGYAASYNSKFTIKGTQASLYISFNYRDIKKTGLTSPQKVRTTVQLNSVIKNAVRKKIPHMTIALADYKSGNYNINNAVKLANEDNSISSGYSASSFIPNSLTVLSSKVIKVKFSYKDENEIEFEGYNHSGTSTFKATQKVLYSAIYKALSNLQKDLPYNSEFAMEEVSEVVSQTLILNPDINYIKNFEISTYGQSAKITFNYQWDQKLLIQMLQETEQKALSVINDIIKKDMDDSQKIKAIHDYLVLNTKYDYENYLNGTISNESYTAYGVLVKGVGVCQGYTAAFNLLCKKVGIKSIGISGTAGGGGHAWNMVKLDGKLLYIDVTWDDPAPDKQGTIKYNYYNVSEEQLSKDHNWDKRQDYASYFQ